jgi:LPS sulfotransferase NodH
MNVRSLAIHQLAQPRFNRAPRRANTKIRKTDPIWESQVATYIICTNPRSGSWLLSEGLASTSLAGKPREWFNTMQEQQHRARWRMDHSDDLTYQAYLRLARTESTTSNGISGIKLHYSQFAELPGKMQSIENFRQLTASQIMPLLFPKARYLWLKRRNKMRQAISLFIASRTGEWWKIEGAAPDRREGSVKDPEFDPHAIARFEDMLVENDSQWRAFFEENRIAPLVIDYEDLVADYSGTIVNILKWLGVPDPDAVHVPPTRLKRQSDARNEEWLARYEAFRKGAGKNLAQDSGSKQPTDPLLDRAQRVRDTIPVAWKQWIAHSKLLRTSDDAIVEVLVGNGCDRAAALAEVNKAAADPYLLGAMHSRQRVRKAAALLNAQEQLARLNSHAKVVDRRRNLSQDEFRDRYYSANRPVIIQGLMDGWRALTAWTPDYLKSAAGDATIEVMANRNADPKYEINHEKHRREMRFADYIDLVHSGQTTNDYYMVANNGFFQRAEVQPLLADFSPLPKYLNSSIGKQCFLWFGPAGTVTPLHHDTSNILLAQVTGRKRYRLIPASQWKYVYNSRGVFSDVDCERPDLNRYPNFRHATVIDLILEAGEVLLMPVGWWHHVRALDVSMTLSFTNFVFPNHFSWG